MSENKQVALVLNLIKRLADGGSWCGETHIQKAVYFLQRFLNGPLSFDFILYKHGPFSFDLRGKLNEWVADGLLVVERRSMPYGPSLQVSDMANAFLKHFPNTLKAYERYIEFVTKRLADKDSHELERLATALYFTPKNGSKNVEKRAKAIKKAKPHIDRADAASAVVYVDKLLVEAAGDMGN